MKRKIPFILLAAAAACGISFAQPVYTTPVGYYTHDGQAGGNIFVPGFVNSSVFTGAITGSTDTTLTVAEGSLAAGELDMLAATGTSPATATHYVEITSAGSNQGVVIDIESNTDSVITLAADISALSLVGDESIVVRPHITLAEALSGSEDLLSVFSDAATFYNSDGSIDSYFYIGEGNWSSDFASPDGNNVPITPGTGFVLNLAAETPLTVSGEVKLGSIVVQLTGGVVNIVGPVNPLFGNSAPISDLGFENLLAFTDSITLYAPGSLTITGTYFALGDGTVSQDFATPSTDEFDFTTGGVVTASGSTSLRIEGVTVTE